MVDTTVAVNEIQEKNKIIGRSEELRQIILGNNLEIK